MDYTGSIKTQYATTPFQSRLEAKYALLFDLCKVKWKYEHFDFTLSKGMYIPDFYLPNQNLIIEIKPYYPGKREINRYKECATIAKKPVALLYGPTPLDAECEIFPTNGKVTFPSHHLWSASIFDHWETTRLRRSPYNLTDNKKVIRRRKRWIRNKRSADGLDWDTLDDPERAWLYVETYKNLLMKYCKDLSADIHEAEDLFSEGVILQAQRISSYYEMYRSCRYTVFMAQMLKKAIFRAKSPKKQKIVMVLSGKLDIFESKSDRFIEVDLKDCFSAIPEESARFLKDHINGVDQGVIAEQNGRCRQYVNEKIKSARATILKKLS